MKEILRKLLFLPEQGSSVAGEVDGLHYFVILTTILGALAVTLIGGYLLFRYRRAHYGATESEEYEDIEQATQTKIPVSLEIAVIAGLLALFFLWWVIGFKQYVKLRVAPEDAQDIYVVGKKWMWKFAYPDGSSSAGVLYVPANQPVRLIMTSRDVLHSFYVPDFRVKQDLVPGRYTTLWFEAVRPGVFEILCAEYCGAGHSTMRGQVVALAPDDYARWLEGTLGDGVTGTGYYERPAVAFEAPEVKLDLATVGKQKAAEVGCLRCHSVDGTAHIGPSFAGLYGNAFKFDDNSEGIVDEAYITESMMDPMLKARVGFKKVMPTYNGLLGAGDTAAIVEYIKSLRNVPAEPRVQRSWL